MPEILLNLAKLYINYNIKYSKIKNILFQNNKNFNTLKMNEINYKPLFNPHCHSSGSLLDGAANIKAYIKKAKEYNHPAITLTDHGSMQMVFALYKAAKEEGVKPIVGCEFYVTTDLENKIPNRQRDVVDRDKHIIVLAKNDIGYKNMCKLNYISLVDGFYYKPRITYDQLFENKEGLIITTACAAGQVNALFTAGRIEESENWFKKLAKEFGEDFYAEIQLNEITAKLNPGSADGTDMDQKAINDNIIALAKKCNVKVIIGGDSHYADKEDSKLQDILINCMMRKDGTEGSSDQSFIHARHLYYQSSEDFYQFNRDFGYEYKESFIDECFKNSLEIVDKCNFEFNIGANNYPKFDLPTNVDHAEYCSQIAYEGLQKKIEERIEKGEEFSDELLEEYENRLDYEIKIINDKGYIDYFLVYWDLVKWAKNNDIAVGCGRGSAAGSLLTYCLDITTIDPLQFGLYFERFMNPERMCVTENNCVLLKDGTFKKIENVKLKDDIQTPKGLGELVQIVERELEENEEVFLIELESGVKMELTSNHIIPIEREGVNLEVRVKELKNTDLLTIF